MVERREQEHHLQSIKEFNSQSEAFKTSLANQDKLIRGFIQDVKMQIDQEFNHQLKNSKE